MAILGNILGNLLGKADTIIDECITSTEEKMQLKNELQKIIQEQEALIEQEVTKRWESDNLQSSWLPRNIRPLVLAWLVLVLVFLPGHLSVVDQRKGHVRLIAADGLDLQFLLVRIVLSVDDGNRVRDQYV